MKTIQITAPNLEETFNQLQNIFAAEYSVDFKEHTLKFDSDLGYGTIKGMKLKGAISFIQFNVTFATDVKLVFTTPKQTLVNFAYCSEGKIEHSFNNRENRTELETFQTGILSNINEETNCLYFSRELTTTASIIGVNTASDTNDINMINEQLRQLFITDRTEDLAYVSSYNLKIAEKIKQLKAIKQEGVVRTLLVEGLVHVILALEIEQHSIDKVKRNQNTGSLTSKEMSAVKDLSEYINNFPETNLTVTELAHKIGLTPSKLQEGFKLMHSRTVNDYIRDVRVTKSEELIKTTDMNISQILYTLGFSSRSYFSKIFKEKYNCSPSQYKAQNKLAATA
ncbi:helix-turn-helix domain-containing protein [Winogradskyella litorisediminis]|uniref:Helix-turn-helix domain-containing protein n=1 Tax=Winogradskyella litorisediminis TaxID=1156618 RepID=A0ABW3N5E8_9FLAO